MAIDHSTHSVIDDDAYFLIDPATRSITTQSEQPLVLIQGDHNSEEVTFAIPKTVDGHDMSLCNKVQVHYINISAANPIDFNHGMFEVHTPISEADGDLLKFSWVVDSGATVYVGPLNFAVRFMCTKTGTDENGEETVIIDYSWNTSPYIGTLVSEGLDSTDALIDKNYDVVDVLVQTWIASIASGAESIEQEIKGRIEQVGSAAVRSISNKSVEANAELRRIVDDAKADTDAYYTEIKQKMLDDNVAEIAESVIVQGTGTDIDKVMSQAATTTELNNLESEIGAQCANVIAAANARCKATEDAIARLLPYAECELNEDGTFNPKPLISYVAKNTNAEYPYQGINVRIDGTVTCVIKSANIPGATILETKTFDIGYDYGTAGISTGNPPGRTLRILECYLELVSDNLGTTMSPTFVHEFILHLKFILDGETYDETKTLYRYPSTGTTDTGRYAAFNWAEDNECRFTISGATNVYVENDGSDTIGDFMITANGISDITKTGTEGLVDTYTITLEDGTQKTFTVTNGVGISSITGSAIPEKYVYRYAVSFTNGRSAIIDVPNANSIGIKTQASGAVIHAEDVMPLEHAVKTKVRSKNIVSTPYLSPSGTVNGVTFTVNDDYSITCVGTAEDGLFASFKLSDVSNLLEPGKTYRLGGSSNLLFAYKDETGTVKYVKNGAIAWSGNYEFVQLYIQYQSSNGAVNETIYPYLYVEGEVDEYTPYVNVANTKLTVCGKNMFDSSKLLAASGWTETNGVYSGNPGRIYDIFGAGAGDDGAFYTAFEPNTQYTISFKGCVDEADKTGLIFRFDYTDGTTLYSPVSINTTTETDYVLTSKPNASIARLSASFGTGVITHLKNIQLEKGTTPTAYEPYSGKTYDVYSDGSSLRVTSVSPSMTIFTDNPNVTIDATYNMDQTAAYNKLNAKLDALLNGG